jgi:hypothetical protein
LPRIRPASARIGPQRLLEVGNQPRRPIARALPLVDREPGEFVLHVVRHPLDNVLVPEFIGIVEVSRRRVYFVGGSLVDDAERTTQEGDGTGADAAVALRYSDRRLELPEHFADLDEISHTSSIRGLSAARRRSESPVENDPAHSGQSLSLKPCFPQSRTSNTVRPESSFNVSNIKACARAGHNTSATRAASAMAAA